MFKSVRFIVCVAGLALAGTAQLRADKPGCEYQPVDVEKYGGQLLRLPPEIRSVDRELDARLTLAYSMQPIAGCETHLRLYDGLLTGPTLEVSPGDTLNVDVVNNLPPDPPPPSDNINDPHGFNRTNLHTHGLHVSPAGNADNVLLEVQPGRRFQNEIKIPRDHPPGTFWYHPHVHGSTAIQVGSGMAGALIVRGGIDYLPQIERMTEQIFVFQQIPYDKNGEVEDFDESFGPGVWDTSHRQTTINGQIFPVIHMRPGEIQRWRMIHGGVRESLELVLDGHQLNEIAVDGLVTGRIDSWNRLELQPGYRSDVLIRARALPAGRQRAEFILYDGETPASRSLLAVDEDRQALAKVVVEGPPMSMQMPSEAALQRFVPFAPIERIDGYQEAVFNISGGQFTVNGREFSPDHRRVLELGKAEEWTLNSLRVNHPFHIHVNPFEHERIGPDGRPQRVWRDTLLVRQDTPIKIRTRYTKYIGTFVLHCHILDHEDQGMMELVEVRLPGSPPDGRHAHMSHEHVAMADEAGHGHGSSARMAAGDAEESEEAYEPPSRVRKSIDDLEPEELENYLHAVRRLKEISDQDPTSKDGYDYFAALHNSGSVGPCEHARDSFLPWHRAHLVEYENALRRSDPPRTSEVTVPYWDWTRIPSGSRYPTIIEDPNSVLYHRGRRTTEICRPGQTNGCEPLPFPWTVIDETLDDAPGWQGEGPYFFGGESNEDPVCRDRQDQAYGALESPSHNDMHSRYIGGAMRSPTTAAEDPIFWSFHAFIDLLWDHWQARSTSSKVDSCLDCQLCGLFKDPQNNVDPWTVKDTVSTAALDYRYEFTPDEVAPAAARVAAFRAVPFDSHPAAGMVSALAPQAAGSQDLLVPTRVDQTVSLRLSSVPRPADVSYRGEVYLHPATESFRPGDPEFRKLYLFDLYSIWRGHGDHARPDVDVVIDLTKEVEALSVFHAGELWKVSVAVVPSEEPTADGERAAAPAPDALMFDAARLQGLGQPSENR